MPDYQVLRQKYPRFIYQTSQWRVEDQQFFAQWHFRTQASSGKDIEFRPSLSLPLADSRQLQNGTENNQSVDPQIMTQLVFHIGLVEMFSYWKATASPEIIIQAGNLNKQQLQFWQNLLIQGMGEYFYVNQLPFWKNEFVRLKVASTNQIDQPLAGLAHSSIKTDGYLVPLGGGKDSIVSLTLMKQFLGKEAEEKIIAAAINPTEAIKQTAQLAHIRLIDIQRQLDPQLLRLNQQGFLNGHTPFSALIAFTTTLVAYLYKLDNIVLSNELSANEPTLFWQNQPINHQYSKSFDFETKFRDYLDELMNQSINHQQKSAAMAKRSQIHYFSFLRPLYELQIARLFTQVGKKYFSIFRSCNVGQKEGIWCGQCPKCLFAFVMIFPFVGEKKTETIFGQNLFADHQLLPLAYQLVGARIDREQNVKPFECVGTQLESLVAFWLATRSYQKRQQTLPFILQQFKQKIFPQYHDLDQQANQIFGNFNQRHFLPKKLATFLKKITDVKIKNL